MLDQLATRIGAAAASGLSLLGIRAGWEKPAYTVLDRLPAGVEVRGYGPRLTAETEAAGAEEDAKERAFETLEAYLAGDNHPCAAIAGAVPAEVQRAPLEIPMTAPVETRTAPGWVRLAFFLPKRFTLATVPEPTNGRVAVAGRPEEAIAALRFSGLPDEAAFAERAEALTSALAGSRWVADGDPALYTYDPPWTLPFLRRNEAVVRVERWSA
jgi:hypothetical protein